MYQQLQRISTFSSKFLFSCDTFAEFSRRAAGHFFNHPRQITKHVNIDNKISVILGYGSDSLKIYAPEQAMGVIKTCRFMTSLYVNEICGSVEDNPACRRMPGDILADTGYAVISGVSAEEGQKYKLTRPDSPGNTRAVELTTPDNKVYRFIANFGSTPVSWCGNDIAPGKCCLFSL